MRSSTNHLNQLTLPGEMPDPSRFVQLRTDEITLWKWLSSDYARQGDAARSRAASNPCGWRMS